MEEMMEEILIANLTLDTVRKNNIPPLVVPRGDYGARVIKVKITIFGKHFAVNSPATVSIVATRKGDGLSRKYSGKVNSDGSVTVPIAQWMLDIPGYDVVCNVEVSGKGYQYSTTNFLIEPQEKENPSEITPDDPRVDVITEVLANENARTSAENERVSNEEKRKSNEEERERFYEETKPLFEGVENFLTNNNIVQTTGDSQTSVMSQDATTRELNQLSEEIDNTNNTIKANVKDIVGVNMSDFSVGAYYKVNSIGSTAELKTHKNWICTKISVSPGDYVYVNVRTADMSSTIPSSAWLDSSGNVLSADSSTYTKEMILVAPQDASYIIINNKKEIMSDGYFAFVGTPSFNKKDGMPQFQRAIEQLTGSKPVYFTQNQYYVCSVGNKPVPVYECGQWSCAKEPVTSGDNVYVFGSVSTAQVETVAWLDQYGIVISTNTIDSNFLTKKTAPAGSAYVVINNRSSVCPNNFVLIGKAMSSGYPVNAEHPGINLYNFSGSNIWTDVSSGKDICKTAVLENLPPCTIRSNIPGLRITLYSASTEHGTSSAYETSYNQITVKETLNYARLRIQAGTSGISDFTNYLDRLIVIEKKGGFANRLTKAETRNCIFSLSDITITSDTNYTFDIPEFNPSNIVAMFEAKYTGAAENRYARPKIKMKSGYGDDTPGMFIGGNGEYLKNKIRFYPIMLEKYNKFVLTITVPSGITLHIKNLRIEYDSSITRAETGIKIDGHAGFRQCPSYSKISVDLVAQLGAPRCVQLPKRSSDGIWFCYHEDTFDISTTFLRNSDGTKIASSEYNGLPFSHIPFFYLDGFDWGIYMNSDFPGGKPCLLSDFFKICAKTGMHPMLSFHPVEQSTKANFEEIKALAKKYGVLKWLTPKVGILDDLQNAFDVFGYDVEGYTVNVGFGASVSDAIDCVDSLNIDKTKLLVCIEQFAGSNTLTESSISKVLSAGYIAGVACAQHTRVDGSSGDDLDSADLEYYGNLGVTNFTSYSFASFGENWG